MSEVPELVEAIGRLLASPLAEGEFPSPLRGGVRGGGFRTSPSVRGPLAGRHVLVTSGPTHEPIDPVRYIANRSSGKQGAAIAAEAAALGARVTLVSGPTQVVPPAGVEVVNVETAREMLDAVRAALPADIAIFAAAVADWRVASEAHEKIKKGPKGAPSLDARREPGHPQNNRRQTALASARRSSSALPPRPKTSSSTRGRSARPRAPTGLSPTTSRPKRVSWVAIATRCT